MAALGVAGAAGLITSGYANTATGVGSFLNVFSKGGTGGTSNTVYQSVNASGQVRYAGITNNLARRAAEHLRARGIQIEKVLGGLSRSDARAVEQTLIEIHGLGKHGGRLLNRINSIAQTNPAYAQQVQRGYQLLQTIGYN